MRKISPAQKKIITAALVVLLAFLTFWLFIYLPSRHRVREIKSELSSIKGQIREIEGIMGKAKSINESIQLLIKRYQQLDVKFPQKEEESLRMLAHLTHKLNIELVSIKPQPKVVFLEQGKNKLEIENKICQRVLVSLEMKCMYKDLVKYIEALKETLPALVTIERLKIDKPGEATGKLNIKLDISLYLLS